MVWWTRPGCIFCVHPICEQQVRWRMYGWRGVLRVKPVSLSPHPGNDTGRVQGYRGRWSPSLPARCSILDAVLHFSMTSRHEIFDSAASSGMLGHLGGGTPQSALSWQPFRTVFSLIYCSQSQFGALLQAPLVQQMSMRNRSHASSLSQIEVSYTLTPHQQAGSSWSLYSLIYQNISAYLV